MKACRDFSLPRWLRWAMLVFLLCSVAASLSVLGVRLPNRYACLRFNNDLLVDLNTGRRQIDTRPKAAASNSYNRFVSPDGQLVAYLVEAGRLPRLYVQNLQPAGQPPVFVSDQISYLDIKSWSPNSRYLAYMVEKTGASRLAIHDTLGAALPQIVIATGVNFLGWSADSAYIAYLQGDTNQRRLSLWSVANGQSITFPPSMTYLSALAWSPSGHQLAIVWQDAHQKRWFSTTQPEYTDLDQLAVPQDSFDHHLVWSPDGRDVLAWYHGDWPRWRIDIYGLDGERYLHVSDNAQSIGEPSIPLAIWSSTSRAVTFLESSAGVQALLVYHLDTRQKETIAAVVHRSVAYAPHANRIAMPVPNGQQVFFVIMDSDGLHRTVLLSGIDEPQLAVWSPDEQTVMALGQFNETGAMPRRVRLAWAHTDGAGLQELHESFRSIGSLQWLPDKRHVVFVAASASSETLFSVQILDVATGALMSLGEGQAQIEDLQQDAQTGEISFWWRGRDGVGYDVYRPDGTRLVRMPSSGSISDNRRVFWSPDHRQIAMRFGSMNKIALQLFSVETGQSMLARTGLHNIGDPSWAPDNWAIAFSQQDTLESRPTLNLVARDGTSAGHIEDLIGVWTGATWTRCD